MFWPTFWAIFSEAHLVALDWSTIRLQFRFVQDSNQQKTLEPIFELTNSSVKKTLENNIWLLL
jgi:hypothetical protein